MPADKGQPEKAYKIPAAVAPLLDQDAYPVGYLTIVGFFAEEKAPDLRPLAVGTAKIISREAGHNIFW